MIVQCPSCGSVPTRRKLKKRRWFRKQGYWQYSCIRDGHRWRVWLSGAAPNGARSAT